MKQNSHKTSIDQDLRKTSNYVILNSVKNLLKRIKDRAPWSTPHLNTNHQLRMRRTFKLPILLQDEIAECGHACVAMISQFFGHSIDLSALRAIKPPNLCGVTLRDIKLLLEHLHFNTRALRVPLNELHLIKTPAILHWNLNHFVVLKHVKKRHLILHDPAIGVRTCRYEAVSQAFTGIVLEVNQSNDFKTIRNHQKLNIINLIQSISGIGPLLGLLFVLSILIELLIMVNPLFIQYVTDEIISTNDLHDLVHISLGFVLFVGFHALAFYTREHLVLYTTTHFIESFSAMVFKHLLSLPPVFFEHRQQGDIQSKFQSIQQIHTKISTDFINTLLDSILFVLNTTIMFYYSQTLTLIVLGAVLLYLLLRYLSYQAFKNQLATSVHLHAKVSSIFLESIRAITPIKLFLKEQMRFNQWRNSHIDALNVDIQISKKNRLYRVFNHVLFNVEQILIIYVGATLVLNHKLTIGMLVAFLAYRLMLVNKASSLIQNILDYQLISVQLNRLSDILFQEPEPNLSPINTPLRLNLSLQVKNISFQYPTMNHYMLHDLSFNISVGEKVVITGPSGCGKSTLLKIMIGLLPPTSGQILIDNIPLNQWGLARYRQNIATVLQDDVLLSGSILDNITFFDEHIDLNQVHQVATWAELHDVIIALPMGYESFIGEMGSILSGGQKQRLLLARALYKRPKILFLDEATSHLDRDNEWLINQTLKSLNITQIMVAHRQETIKMADRVIDLTQL